MTHLVHAGDVRAAAGVSFVFTGVRWREVSEDGDLSVELVRPRTPRHLAPLSASHLQAGQLVAFKTRLPVVRSLHQLFRHQLAGEDQILQPRALALFLGADQGIRVVARGRKVVLAINH